MYVRTDTGCMEGRTDIEAGFIRSIQMSISFYVGSPLEFCRYVL